MCTSGGATSLLYLLAKSTGVGQTSQHGFGGVHCDGQTYATPVQLLALIQHSRFVPVVRFTKMICVALILFADTFSEPSCTKCVIREWKGGAFGLRPTTLSRNGSFQQHSHSSLLVDTQSLRRLLNYVSEK